MSNDNEYQDEKEQRRNKWYKKQNFKKKHKQKFYKKPEPQEDVEEEKDNNRW